MGWSRALPAMLLLGCAPEYQILGSGRVDPADVLPCAFEAVDGAAFLERYACNPVFHTTAEPWAESIVSVAFRTQWVLGAPVHQAWYIARTPPLVPGDWAIGHATSTDGTTWMPHPDNPVSYGHGDWDADGADQLVVVRDPARDRYLAAYQGYTLGAAPSFGMGLLAGSSAVDLAPVPTDGPLVDLSEPVDGIDYCWPIGLSWDPTGYTGWMAGHRPGAEHCQLYAFQVDDPVDGIDLEVPTAQPEVVLGAGPAAYDAGGMSAASAVVVGGVHYLFYVGFAGFEPIGDGLVASHTATLNLAVGYDGRTWRKYDGNPLPVHLTEAAEVTGVAAQAVDGRVQLWVTDHYDAVGGQAVGYYRFDPAALP